MISTITNKAFVTMVAIATVLSLSFMTLSTATAGENDALEALLLGLGLTQEQVDTVIASMGSGSAGTGTDETSCGTTEEYTHHPDINYKFTQYIYFGSRGTEVEMLQRVLASYGAGAADGAYGPMTKAAVMSFQRANGLGVDGKVGPQTRAELNKVTSTTVECENGDGDNDGDGDGDTVSGNKLEVSGLASDDMIIGNNQTVVFSKLTLKAGDKDVKVKKVNVKFTGSADASVVIDDVVLLDSAMVVIDTDNLDSDDEGTLKADLVVKDGESVTVYVAAKTTAFPATSNGLDGSIKVTSITTDEADVEGDSIMGASHEFHNAVSADKFDTKLENEGGDVRIGEEEVKATTITVEAEGDNQTVRAIKLTRTGTAGDDALSNVEMKVAGETYKATQDDDEYTFDLGAGVVLAEDGDDEDFEVYVDVEDDSTKTFAFALTDVVVVDEDGVLLSEHDGVFATDTEDFTIELSEVKISKTTDVQSEKVAAGADKAELASFDVEVTGKDVEGDLEVTIEINGVAGGTDTKDIDLDNVAIYTKSGSKVSDKEDTSFTAIADGTTYVVTFDDVKFDEGDDAVDYVIKADINEDAPTGTEYTVEQIKYVSIEDKDGEDIADVTESIASPAVAEVEGAAITISVEEAEDTDLNADADGVIVAELKLDATDSGDDVKVSKIKLAYAIDTSAAAPAGDGATAPEAVIGDLVNCELFDGGDSVSDAEDAGASVTYNVDITVTKDTEKTLFVKCDIGDEFENADTITVTGISYDAKGVTTDADLDDAGFNATTTTATVTTGSTVFNLTTDDANDDKVVRDNADDVVLGVYEFKAKDAELTVDDVTVTFTANIAALVNGKVSVYINGHEEDSVTPTNTASFTNLNKTVVKDETITIEFKADMDADGSIEIDSVAMTTEEGVAVTSEDDNGPAVTVVEALPVVTQVSETQRDSVNDADDMVLFAYKVKAVGGDIALKTMRVNLAPTDATLTNVEAYVYDNSARTGSEEEKVVLNAGQQAGTADIAFNVAISENDTYYVFIIADVVSDGGTVKATLTDTSNGATFATSDSDADGDVDANDATNLTIKQLIDGDMKSRIDFAARD